MTMTSVQLKCNISLVDNVAKEDILVTKRGKPFVVIMDSKRYEEKNEVIDTTRKPRDGWNEKFKDRG